MGLQSTYRAESRYVRSAAPSGRPSEVPSGMEAAAAQTKIHLVGHAFFESLVNLVFCSAGARTRTFGLNVIGCACCACECAVQFSVCVVVIERVPGPGRSRTNPTGLVLSCVESGVEMQRGKYHIRLFLTCNSQSF